MKFWITYIEVKALYPFITDGMLADWIERRTIEVIHSDKDRLSVTSNDMPSLRYKKESLANELLSLFKYIADRIESRLKYAEVEEKILLSSCLTEIVEKIKVVKYSVAENKINLDADKTALINLYKHYLDRLYATPDHYELWQQVNCYYEAYINNATNKALANRFGKSERTIPRWIESGENYAVHDPAGPRLPALTMPPHRRK
ncbi:hypothetical protein DFW101_1070 [Solidesulfovibrio carbinoliphilus subsp. oakridgensis]|uniref:Uncharacterized protein n=1 Tax=Solidesulfovibrio carbinoliphilus subsp. oakridgensis TaxID=694327 RepID=G7Q665_9BACT|nr:hypothetical protein [Solidesulfovibrio carbinoliphilus]EHJ47081.1 hypothetical protein DFW101_1070 [Solidesulfovibrio carbinoliphilus subsp. oakridgensis]